MKTNTFIITCYITCISCKIQEDSDSRQRDAQERILAEGVSQVGLPAIHNFFEKRTLKDIYELRDQANLSTITYIQAEQTGQLVYLCDSIGYGVPVATQFTNPMKVGFFRQTAYTIPQADPNGLFSPSSAEGTWVLCKDPNGKDVKPVYVEPRITVSQFDLRKRDTKDEQPKPKNTQDEKTKVEK
jgi:hypothetical protein